MCPTKSEHPDLYTRLRQALGSLRLSLRLLKLAYTRAKQAGPDCLIIAADDYGLYAEIL